MNDAPTTKAEKRFHLGCLLVGLAAVVGPVLYFVIIWLVEPSVGFVPPTLSSSKVVPESLAFGPVGERLALADREGNVSVWNIRTGAIEFHVKRDVEQMEQPPLMAWSPNSDQVAVGFRDGELAVWSMGDSANRWSEKVSYDIRKLAWSDDGSQVGVIGQLRLGIWPVVRSFDGSETTEPFDMLTAPSEESRFGATSHKKWGDSQGRLSIENTVRNEKTILPIQIDSIAEKVIAPDGHQAYIATRHTRTDTGDNVAGVIHVINIAGGYVQSTVPFGNQDEALSILALAISPDGKVVAVGLPDGVHLFDVDERGRLRRWAADRVVPTPDSP